MGNSHSKSFFGQKTGLIVQSSSKEQPFIFFQCIKKKADQSWEKPSQGEGKKVKLSLEELISIVQVLQGEETNWNTIHKFKDETTSIGINWGKDENGKKIIWIKIGDYSKMLKGSQIKLLELLLSHILVDKIEFATVSNISRPPNVDNNNIKQDLPERLSNHNISEKNNIKVTEEVISREEIKKLSGEIKGSTEKALLINFSNGNEVWIPKSTIKSTFEEDNREHQSFLISSWVLQKNKIEI